MSRFSFNPFFLALVFITFTFGFPFLIIFKSFLKNYSNTLAGKVFISRIIWAYFAGLLEGFGVYIGVFVVPLVGVKLSVVSFLQDHLLFLVVCMPVTTVFLPTVVLFLLSKRLSILGRVALCFGLVLRMYLWFYHDIVQFNQAVADFIFTPVDCAPRNPYHVFVAATAGALGVGTAGGVGYVVHDVYSHYKSSLLSSPPTGNMWTFPGPDGQPINIYSSNPEAHLHVHITNTTIIHPGSGPITQKATEYVVNNPGSIVTPTPPVKPPPPYFT